MAAACAADPVADASSGGPEAGPGLPGWWAGVWIPLTTARNLGMNPALKRLFADRTGGIDAEC
jgi:hypothetical protein